MYLFIELVREHESEWHFLWRLVGRVSEHNSLISGSHIVFRAVNVDSLRNVRRLLANTVDHRTCYVVETFVVTIVTNILIINISKTIIKKVNQKP